MNTPFSRRFRRNSSTSQPRGHFETLENRQLLAADFGGIGQELAQGLESIDQQVADQLFDDISLPLLGSVTNEQAPDLFSDGLLDQLQTALSTFDKDGAIPSEDALRNTLTQALQLETSNIQFESLNLEPGEEDIRIVMPLTYEAIEVQLGEFDKQLGISFLPIEFNIDTEVVASLSFTLDAIAFGYSADEGHFFEIVNPSDGPELDVDLNVNLAESVIEGSFGLLADVTIENNFAYDGGTHAGISFGVDLASDGAFGSVTASPEIAVHLTVTAEAQANILPWMQFNIDWATGNNDTWDGGQVAINDVKVGFGSLVDTVLFPVADALGPILQPIATALGWAAEPIPGVSDLIGQNVTLLDMLEIAEQFESLQAYQPLIAAAGDFIQLVDTLDDIECNDNDASCALELGNFNFADHDNLKSDEFNANYFSQLIGVEGDETGMMLDIDSMTPASVADVFGSFDVAAFADRVHDLLIDLGDQGDDKSNKLEHLAGVMYDTIMATQNGYAISTPFLENPRTLVNLILGRPQDVEIFNFRASFIEGEEYHDQVDDVDGFATPFHNGLSAGLEFDIDPLVNIELGYDATGIFNTIKSQGDLSRLADGFWMSRPFDQYEQVVSLGASITATVQFNYLLLGAGVDGTVSADLGLSYADTIAGDDDGDGFDDDGKIYLASEMGHKLFDLTGSIGGELSVWWEVGYELFGKCFCIRDEIFSIGDEVSFETSFVPNPFWDGLDEIDLVEFDETSGELILKIGPQADPAADWDQNESFRVFMDEHDDGTSSLMISFLGVEQDVAQRYGIDVDQIERIVAWGGAGDDTIIIDQDVPYDAELHGQVGADKLIYRGTGSAALFGGAGSDTLESQGWINYLDGGFHNDTLTGSSRFDDAMNILLGSSGDDVLNGGAGNNWLTGGDDDGNDQLFAGTGNTHMIAGAGNDVLVGGTGLVNMDGGTGNDTLTAGSGNAFMYGGVGNDTYHAGAGHNVVLDPSLIGDVDAVHWNDGDGLLDISVENDAFVTQQDSGQMSLSVQGGDAADSFLFRRTSYPQIVVDAGDFLIGEDMPLAVDTEMLLDGNTQIRIKNMRDLTVDGSGGQDEISVLDLHAANSFLENIAINPTGSADPDGAQDDIFVEATDDADVGEDLVLSAHDAVTSHFDVEECAIVSGQETCGLETHDIYGATMVLSGMDYIVSAMVNDEDYMQVDMFAGDDELDVYGGAGTIQINTGRGDDEVTFFVDELGYTDAPPNWGAPVPGYLGHINYDAGQDTNTMVVTAVRSDVADTFTLTNQSVSSDRMELDYKGEAFSTIALTGSKADVGDTILVYGTLDTGSTTNYIFGHDGSDTVVLGLDGSLDGIDGLLNVWGQAGDGDHLILDDSSATHGNGNVQINANSITGIAGADDNTVVQYVNTSLEVLGSDAENLSEVFHLNDPSGATTVRGNAGVDTLDVQELSHLAWFFGGFGDDLVLLTENLDLINATLAVFGEEDDDEVQIDDSAAEDAKEYTLAATSFQRGGMNVTFDASLETLDFVATQFDDQLQITSDPVVAVALLDFIQGTDTITGPDEFTSWTIDGSNSGRMIGHVNFQAEVIQGGIGDDEFVLQDGAEIEVIDGGSGDGLDVVQLDYSTAPTVDLEHQTAGDDVPFADMERIVGGHDGDVLFGGDLDTVWQITGANEGSVFAAWGSIQFAAFGHLQGGSQSDYFTMQPAGSIAGTLDTGGDGDWLYYTSFTSDVYVNFAAGTATSVGGAIANIENVVGGTGNDILIGDAADNFMQGGAGRDLLIGGLGADALHGGADDDLLIGGATIYDLSQSHLDAVMAEWSRTNIGAKHRMAHLQSGGGLNGKVVLNDQTVIDDDTVDHIFGEQGTDLWFPSADDVEGDNIELESSPLGKTLNFAVFGGK